jgi:hypothetical protein
MAQVKSRKARKTRANTVGYGILALYAGVLVLGGLGVYGWTFTSVFPLSGDNARAQAQTGRMLFATDDRVRCRSYTFDNETAQMTPRGITDCDERGGSNQMGASFGVFQDSFRR